jgi:environmental stress-induced protein Ves
VSAPEIVEYTAIPPTPWKNGRGITRNLFDDATETGEWTWRVSIAEITGTQPYSPYPGVRRGQVALGPGAVDLRIGGVPFVLEPEGVIFFDGEDAVDATPRAEGFLDLNVMTRRDAWRNDVRIAADPEVIEGDGAVVVLVALSTDASVDGRALQRLDAVRMPAGAAADLRGRYAIARIARSAPTER